MKIDIRHVPPYCSVKIEEGSTSVDLGLLNEKERKELAEVLVNAACELGPRHDEDWFADVLSECGINVYGI